MGFRDEDMLLLFGTQIMLGIVSIIIIITAIMNPPLDNADTEYTSSTETKTMNPIFFIRCEER